MEPSGQSNADLKKIFESFDLDKSGSIDIKQIGNVAEKLGKPLPASQLSQIMKKLDTNKDGKISFGQFQYWWTKGMQGKMAQIVYLKAKAMKMTNLIKDKFKNANITLQGHKGSPKPDIYRVKVQFGAEVPDSIKIDFGFYVKSPKQTELRERIKKFVPDLKNNLFGLVLKLPSKNPAQSKVALDHLFNFIVQDGALPIPIQNLQQNSFLKVKSIVRDQQLILQLCLQAELQNAMAPVSSQVQGIINGVGNGFYSNVDFNFSINSSFDNILTDPLLNNLLKGFNLNFSIQANNSTVGKLRKLAEKQQLGLPALFNLITLFRCAKLKLKIKSPQQLSKFFKKLGIQDMITVLPTLKDILQDQSKNISEQVQNDKLLNFLYRLSQYAFKHVQNDVQIFILAGNLGTGRLRFQGKNVSKIHSILFNEL